MIFDTKATMTRALEQMAVEGIAVNKALLASLSPYHTEHINRFGNYILNFARIPAPLPSQFMVPPPSRTEPPSAVLSALGNPNSPMCKLYAALFTVPSIAGAAIAETL